MLSSPFGLAMCLLTFTVKGVLASGRLLSSDVLGRVCVLGQSYAAYCLATVPNTASHTACKVALCNPECVVRTARANDLAAALCCIALWQMRLGLRRLEGLPAGASTVLGVGRFRFSKYSFNHAYPRMR